MSAPVQSLQPSIVQRISFLIARHGNVLNNDLNAVLRDSAARIEELERDLAETEREVDAFSTISPLQYQKEAATLQARAEQAERAVDVLESNARVQAKLLADTGRRAEEMEAALRRCLSDLIALKPRADTGSARVKQINAAADRLVAILESKP